MATEILVAAPAQIPVQISPDQALFDERMDRRLDTRPAEIPYEAYGRFRELSAAGILPQEDVIINTHHEAVVTLPGTYTAEDVASWFTGKITGPGGTLLELEGATKQTLDVYTRSLPRWITSRNRLHFGFDIGNRSLLSHRVIVADFALWTKVYDDSWELDQRVIPVPYQCVYVERQDAESPSFLSGAVLRTQEFLDAAEARHNGLCAIVLKEVIGGTFGEEHMWGHRSACTRLPDGQKLDLTRMSNVQGMKDYLRLQIHHPWLAQLKQGIDMKKVQESLTGVILGEIDPAGCYSALCQGMEGEEATNRIELEYKGDGYKDAARMIVAQIVKVLSERGIPFSCDGHRKVSLC